MPRDAMRAAAAADIQILIPAIADDGSLFSVEKMEAHRRGLLHLAVSVFVFAGDEMLIQRRAAGKYHSGGQWAQCGRTALARRTGRAPSSLARQCRHLQGIRGPRIDRA